MISVFEKCDLLNNPLAYWTGHVFLKNCKIICIIQIFFINLVPVQSMMWVGKASRKTKLPRLLQKLVRMTSEAHIEVPEETKGWLQLFGISIIDLLWIVRTSNRLMLRRCFKDYKK